MSKQKAMTKPAKVAGKSTIKWRAVEVLIANIKPTDKNYKIKTDLGMERFRQSVNSFGMAGAVVCNWTGKVGDTSALMLIDGNTRWQDALDKKEKKIWASVPDRKLTPAEFREFSAMFDFAKAGEVDMERIQQDLGKTEDFYKKYGIQIPMGMLGNMGKNAPPMDKLEYPEEGKQAAAPQVSDIKMVQLFFSEKQEAEFRKMEEKLKTKYKLGNTTDTVFKAFKLLTKGK